MNPAIVLVVLLLLGGCANVEELERENQTLKAELAAAQAMLIVKQAQRAAELSYADQQASIAAACDWGVPICPRSVTDIGHDAKRRGFTGGGWQFWLVVIAKFAMLATVMGGAVGGFVWTWFKVAMPASKARQVAQHLVDNAQRQADEAASHEKSAMARAQEIEKATVQAKITLAEMRIVLDSTASPSRRRGKNWPISRPSAPQLPKPKLKPIWR